MSIFTIPEKFSPQYDGLKMTSKDWRDLEKIVSESTYQWAWTEYQKRLTDNLVYCDCNPCACSYNNFGLCGLNNYCSHQLVKQG